VDDANEAALIAEFRKLRSRITEVERVAEECYEYIGSVDILFRNIMIAIVVSFLIGHSNLKIGQGSSGDSFVGGIVLLVLHSWSWFFRRRERKRRRARLPAFNPDSGFYP
jgi:hypothetical protein